jgi:hypothetical protein
MQTIFTKPTVIPPHVCSGDDCQSCRTFYVNFLRNHPRYHTMNYHNRSTSYANCIKLTQVGILEAPNTDQAFDLLQCDDWNHTMSMILNDFAAKHCYLWQIGSNGRSGGYLVLYQGFNEPDTFTKSICNRCGLRTAYEGPSPSVCCKGGTLNPVTDQRKIGVYPGKSTDHGETFRDWDLDSLRDRTELVHDFDTCCDQVVAAFVEMLRDNEVVEETIMVPKKILVTQPR